MTLIFSSELCILPFGSVSSPNRLLILAADLTWSYLTPEKASLRRNPQHPSMSLKLAFTTANTLVHTPARFTIYRTAVAPVCHHCAAVRRLSTTPPLFKKGGGKQEQKRTVEINSAKTASRDDAHDFSGFQHEIDKATDYLKSELSKLRAGGLDLEAIEALKISLGTSRGGGGGGPKKDGARAGGKGRVDTLRLGDVAQVVPRGRIVVIMVGEKEVILLFMQHCGHWLSNVPFADMV